MKRDWELIRKILLKLEHQPEASGYLDFESIKGFKPEKVAYHFDMMQQAGLISGKASITWAGHEFLDSVRNDTAWNKIKSTIIEKGLGITFDSIKAAAAFYVSKLLGNF